MAKAIQRQPIPFYEGKAHLIPASLASTSIETAYVRQGTGRPPIILLPGFDSSLLEFRYLFPELSAHHRVWAVDLLGFGFTRWDQKIPITPLTLKHHLFSVWTTCIREPVILVGASLGGAIALDFALSYPDCVSRLVLIDSVGFSGSFPIGKFLISPLDTLAVGWLRWRKAMALKALLAIQHPDSRLVDLLRCAMLHQDMPEWTGAIASFTRSGGHSTLNTQIHHVQQPTLILWGESDDILGTGDAERFKQAIADSTLIWIPNSGHVPHIEQPELTAREILAFSQPTLA